MNNTISYYNIIYIVYNILYFIIIFNRSVNRELKCAIYDTVKSIIFMIFQIFFRFPSSSRFGIIIQVERQIIQDIREKNTQIQVKYVLGVKYFYKNKKIGVWLKQEYKNEYIYEYKKIRNYIDPLEIGIIYTNLCSMRVLNLSLQ